MLTTLKRQKQFFIVYLLVAAVLALSQPGYYRWLSDDHYFATILNTLSLGEYMLHRYINWSGRLGIELVILPIIGHPLLWRILNFGCILALNHGLAILLTPKEFSRKESAGIAFFAIFLINPVSIFFACFWETGSMNYLWPVTAGVYALLPFLSDTRITRPAWIGLAFASAYTVYNEQVCLVFLPLAIIGLMHRISQKQSIRGQVILLVIAVLNAVVLFASPGSYVRLFSEIAYRMPEFSDFSSIDRLSLGMQLVAQHLHAHQNFVPMLTTLLAFAALLAHRPTRQQRAFIWLGIAACTLFMEANMLLSGGTKKDWLLTNSVLDASNQLAIAPYVVIFGACAFYIALAAITALAFRNETNRFYIAPILILASLLSTVVLGFSPTVFASGARVLFLPDLLLAAVDVMLVYKLIQLHARRAAICILLPFMILSILLMSAQIKHGGANMLGYHDPAKIEDLI